LHQPGLVSSHSKFQPDYAKSTGHRRRPSREFLAKRLRVEAVPRETWQAVFESQGTSRRTVSSSTFPSILVDRLARDQGKKVADDAERNSLRRRPRVLGFLPIIVVMLGAGEVLMSQAREFAGVKNVVLVHGGFVDGFGWEGVYKALKKDGYRAAACHTVLPVERTTRRCHREANTSTGDDSSIRRARPCSRSPRSRACSWSVESGGRCVFMTCHAPAGA
jgi:hypothetical protein